MRLRVRQVLLGERIELTGELPSNEVLDSIRSTIDARRLGFATDGLGEHDFIGAVTGSSFWVRQRRRLFMLQMGRYRPTVVGRVLPDGTGSRLEARFRGDPWNRLAFLILLSALLASTMSSGLGASEFLFAALIVGVNVYAMELARRPLRDFLDGCMTAPVRSLQWDMS